MKSVEFLKEKEIKITKARVAICDILLNSKDSVTADFLYDNCRNLGINVNLSTVYRTLELFEEKDFLEKFDIGNGKYCYIFKKEKHFHKLECSHCHREIDVPCPMKHIEEILKSQTGFILTEHTLILKGVCEECKEKCMNEICK